MRTAIVILAILLFGSLGVSAQPATPGPSSLFPAADALGPGWVQQSAFDVPLDRYPYFERFAGTMYLGPAGSRALAGYYEIAAGQAATFEAWSGTNAMMDIWGESFTIDTASQEDLDALPPVAGCTDMRRLQGKDLIITVVRVSMSLCGAEPDVMVFAYVSGSVDGLAGHQASDRVVELVLESSGLS